MKTLTKIAALGAAVGIAFVAAPRAEAALYDSGAAHLGRGRLATGRGRFQRFAGLCRGSTPDALKAVLL